MDIRDTLLSVLFPPVTREEPFVEVDLRSLTASRLAGHRGQLQFTTKLVFKASDEYRQDQAVIQLWAAVRAMGSGQVPLPDFGRAVIPEPIIFAPTSSEGVVATIRGLVRTTTSRWLWTSSNSTRSNESGREGR